MFFRNAAALGFLFLSSFSSAQGEPQPITDSENFRLYCNDGNGCGTEDDPALMATLDDLLAKLEDARAWLSDLGFPVFESHLESGNEDIGLLRLDPSPPNQNRCPNAVACHVLQPGYYSRMFVPLHRAEDIAQDPSTLAHEYLHTIQPERDPGELKWFNEAVATAVGTAFGRRHGFAAGVFPPDYFMSLDRPFYDAVDAGYGNWAYLLGVGQALGSEDWVAYLAQPGILNAAEIFAGQPASAGMIPLYDDGLVGSETFDKVFPKFVATFNNVGKSSAPHDSAYHYYTDIDRHTVEILSTDQAYSEVFKGTSPTYAVAPMLMQLELTPQPDARARDTLMMAELEVMKGEPLDDLTLVTEHKRADERLSEKLMLNGSNAPDELGFVRVVNAPSQAQGDAKPNEFELRVSARPIEFGPPICFQAGEPSTFDTNGFDPDEGTNWRLTTDNGTVNGVTITPAGAGEMNVHLEIDSPITRADTGLAPVEPATTKVKLGRFDVMDEDCILVGNMTAHFSGAFAGSPNEIPFAEKATVRWQAVLNIETGSPETETDPVTEKERLVYPDDGSEWMLSGSYLHERCAPGHPEICNYWTEEIFSGAGSIADGGGELRIVSDDDVVRLEAKLPVTVTTTVHGPSGEETRSRTHFWALTCYSPGRWWGFGPHMTHAGPPDGALDGSWASDAREVVNFDCRQERQPEVYGPGSGESGSTSLSLKGRVKVQSR
ncbi:hypothetical protein [Chelativorans sp. YIM 93263]|uniref:hypothetical protein n=1 Tax=Chelativorans sp. YIM 93263 TaxID=2906648 RepID=UPI0023782439|nr:hypothetical protein [Chelativorans sp. YIM 93263]